MPLTAFQQELLSTLASSADSDRYLAGGAALHFAPNSLRFSDDLDFFHDTAARVAEAFARDRAVLEANGYTVHVELSLPGFVRTLVERHDGATRVDWAHDSAWRFMPLVHDERGGLLLHPIDLAINKLLALAGRDEARDFVDILYAHRTILPLAGLVWAAVGKDSGLTPLSLLELLQRRGRPRTEEVARLQLAQPFDVIDAKREWLDALRATEAFVRSRPPSELGCLYWDTRRRAFVLPDAESPIGNAHIVPHFGTPGGVIPRVVDPSTNS